MPCLPLRLDACTRMPWIASAMTAISINDHPNTGYRMNAAQRTMKHLMIMRFLTGSLVPTTSCCERVMMSLMMACMEMPRIVASTSFPIAISFAPDPVMAELFSTMQASVAIVPSTRAHAGSRDVPRRLLCQSRSSGSMGFKTTPERRGRARFQVMVMNGANMMMIGMALIAMTNQGPGVEMSL